MHSDLSTSRQANPCLTTLLNICRKPHGTIGTKFAYRHLQVNQSWTLGVRHHNSSVNYHCLWSDILQTASNENSRFICVRLKCLIFLLCWGCQSFPKEVSDYHIQCYLVSGTLQECVFSRKDLCLHISWLSAADRSSSMAMRQSRPRTRAHTTNSDTRTRLDPDNIKNWDVATLRLKLEEINISLAGNVNRKTLIMLYQADVVFTVDDT